MIYFSSIMSFIFIDFEGDPVIEAAAIVVGTRLNIIDVFHGFAASRQSRGSFPTRHVHGLSQEYLLANGFRWSEELLQELNEWLRRWPSARLVANDPSLESAILSRRVDDAGLPPWRIRDKLQAHDMALAAKRMCLKIGGVSCSHEAHNYYIGWPQNKTDSDRAKKKWGHHCALYDCYELYLYMRYDCWGDLMLDC